MLLSNQLKVTSNVAADRLDPRTKIGDKFLAEKPRNNECYLSRRSKQEKFVNELCSC